MDLRSGQPYWLLKNDAIAAYPSLTRDESCDVAIIGGGITGSLVAYYLTQAGVDSVLLDKRDVGTGSTAASTGLLQYEIDTELSDLIRTVGDANAVRSYRLGLQAIETLRDVLVEAGDPCGFESQKSLYVASKHSHLKRLRKEFECRKQFGFDVEYLEPSEIERRFPFTARGGILSSGDAQIDPFRAAHVLIRAAVGRGLRVYDRSRVARLKRSADAVILETETGHQVIARRVVFATGYEAQEHLEQRVGDLNSTFALVTEPVSNLDDWTERCLRWETARPYFYLRTTQDNRLMIGGVDAPFATDHDRDDVLRKKTKALERRLHKLLPDYQLEVSHAWAGTFSETKDGLPYIGETHEFPLSYFALGYGGNGITFSVIAARIITDLYRQRPNPDAAIFRFDR